MAVCVNPQQAIEDVLSEDIASVHERERRAFDQTIEATDGRFVLFGAGSLCRSVLKRLAADHLRPLAIADNNAALWGTRIDGIPVLCPAESADLFGRDAAFFVTIWVTGHRYADTHAQLTQLGCKHVYPAASLRWKYWDTLLPFFLQDLPSKVYEAADRVRAAFDLWGDDESRSEYVSQIRYRALGDVYGLSAPGPDASYFLDDEFSLEPGEVFVDCGAYDGDTVREVIARQPEFGRILAFEPDPDTFNQIQAFLSSLPGHQSSRIDCFPYGVSSERGRVRFNADAGLGSAISDSGGIAIDVVALDELVYDAAPTFVKMDIEGAEVEALKGLRKTIDSYHPILSICLYHRQSDLWEIPLWIHSADPAYRHVLRAHECDGWQTVGYAIPRKRLKR